MREVQPNEVDWMNVSNDLIKVLNDLRKITGEAPLPAAKAAIPSEAELDAWEKAVPGISTKLKEMAVCEANHRIRMEGYDKREKKINKIFFTSLGIMFMIVIFTYILLRMTTH